MDIPNLGGRDLEHTLLTDIRPIQQEIWKVSQLRCTTGDDSPVWTVDTDAFEAAGGSVAGELGQETYWEQDEDGNWEQIYVPGESERGPFRQVPPRSTLSDRSCRRRTSGNSTRSAWPITPSRSWATR